MFRIERKKDHEPNCSAPKYRARNMLRAKNNKNPAPAARKLQMVSLTSLFFRRVLFICKNHDFT
jgi:hypothetical protein